MSFDLQQAALDLGFQLDDVALQRFERYRDAILAAGFNLTAARDRDRIESRHFVEALALGRLLLDHGLLAASTRVLDIGSGAGFPGLPLKIALPDITMALLEANGKKAGFLTQMAAELSLGGVSVLTGRAEDLGHDPAQRGRYDLVLARAVAPLPVLLEYALPFLAVGGSLAATKGSAAPTELEASTAALRELGGELADTLPFEPPGGRAQTLIVIRKTAETPSRYSRRAGIPSKRPIA